MGLRHHFPDTPPRSQFWQIEISSSIRTVFSYRKYHNAGTPRMPPRVLASGPKPCRGNYNGSVLLLIHFAFIIVAPAADSGRQILIVPFQRRYRDEDDRSSTSPTRLGVVTQRCEKRWVRTLLHVTVGGTSTSREQNPVSETGLSPRFRPEVTKQHWRILVLYWRDKFRSTRECSRCFLIG